LQKQGHQERLEESEATMPLKPNGALCRVREQIIEDAPSGLTLQFECDDGGLRLVIEGREAAAGTLVGEFRELAESGLIVVPAQAGTYALKAGPPLSRGRRSGLP
jgi:hypothetical protein